MIEFIKKMSQLLEELKNAEGFSAICVVDEIKRTYNEHIEEVVKERFAEVDK